MRQNPEESSRLTGEGGCQREKMNLLQLNGSTRLWSGDNAKKDLNLDFDDAYQYYAATYYKMKIIILDRDFEKNQRCRHSIPVTDKNNNIKLEKKKK